MPQDLPLLLTATVVPGSGRGKDLRVPTINLNMEEIPRELAEGIYACRARLSYRDGSTDGPFDAAMHFGPRPVFKDTPSCEVHLLDATPKKEVASVKVGVLAYLREVRDFPSPEAMVKQIGEDAKQARAILNNEE